MAFGFPPKHVEEFYLDGLNPKQFLVLAIEAASSLDWTVSDVSENGFTAYTKMSVLSWGASVEVFIEEELSILRSTSTGSEVVDWGKNKKNIAQFIEKFDQIRAILSNEAIASKYEELKGSMIVEDGDMLHESHSTGTGNLGSFLSIFVPVKGFFITPILLTLNISVFIIMVIKGVNILSPNIESLIIWGANLRPLTVGGDLWRLLTSCFLHGGIIHLLFNMYALLYIGIILEPIIGKSRFLSAYLLTGIAGSMASIWHNELTTSVGASGAIFGMYGVFLALLTTDFIEKNARKQLLVSIIVFVSFNLMSGVRGDIDNAAHIGGLLSGIIIGYAFVPGLRNFNSAWFKFSTIGGLTVVFFLSLFLVYERIPKNMAVYDEITNELGRRRLVEEVAKVPEKYDLYSSKMDEFYKLEAKAMSIYDEVNNLTKEQVIYELQENGVKNWERALKITEEIERLQVQQPLVKKNLILKEYCELRIKRYKLTIKLLQKPSNKDKEEIDRIDKRTDEISVLLGGSK